jgi:hypothetical protein
LRLFRPAVRYSNLTRTSVPSRVTASLDLPRLQHVTDAAMRHETEQTCHLRDRAPAFTGLGIPRRAAVFADAYQMTDQQRRDLTPLLIRVARRYHLSARAAADADPVFRRFWEQGDKDKLPRAEAWLRQAAPAIAERLNRRPRLPALTGSGTA